MNIFPTVAVPFYVPTHVPSSARRNGFPLPPTVSSAHCGLSHHTLLTCPVCSRLPLEPSCLSTCLTSSPAQTFPAKPSSSRRMALMPLPSQPSPHCQGGASPSVVSDSLWPHALHRPWDSPGQNTGVGGLSLLQGIFPTQGSNPGLLHCRQILYQLSHKGSPRILEWGSLSLLQGELPDPGIELGSPTLQENSLPTELSGKLLSIWWVSPAKY